MKQSNNKIQSFVQNSCSDESESGSTWLCSFCQKIFSSKSNIRRHYRKFHKVKHRKKIQRQVRYRTYLHIAAYLIFSICVTMINCRVFACYQYLCTVAWKQALCSSYPDLHLTILVQYGSYKWHLPYIFPSVPKGRYRVPTYLGYLPYRTQVPTYCIVHRVPYRTVPTYRTVPYRIM